MSEIEEYFWTADEIEWIDGLRELVAFFERHPQLIPPRNNGVEVTNWIHPPYNTPDDERRDAVLDIMRPLVRSLKQGADLGEIKKLNTDYMYGFERDFGPHKVIVSAYASDTCEIVVTNEVEERVTYDIPESVQEVYRQVTTVPVTKKVCPKLFGDNDL